METQMERLRRFADQQTVIRPGDLERLAVPRNYLGRLVRAEGWRGLAVDSTLPRDHPAKTGRAGGLP